MTLAVGAEAPDFTLKTRTNPSPSVPFRGRKNVLLVFFPLAFTGICQGELDAVRDNLPEYENDDTVTWPSRRPPPTHKIWATESGFTFPVLSDFWPHGAVAEPTACSTPTPGIANQGTFVIDREGIVRFAEMNQPGGPRPTRVDRGLAALQG